MQVKYMVDYEKIRKENLSLVPSPRINRVGSFGDAGIDLFSPIQFGISSGSFFVVDTFVRVFLPPFTVGLLRPRGGDAFLIGSGVIDSGYTGTIMVRIVNPYSYDLVFRPGSSVGQLVIVSRPQIEGLLEVTDTNDIEKFQRERGERGRITKEVFSRGV